ncbi:hypothetical protein P153DRAFT_288630 [Dothidotthia symphoricarpi CBS 119687]|uniref:CST complex subunit STN1 n=1 Tax=Dothidotthia symphoricarpi CBS 119687 TaxID=1392245 RepID=A0A6A6AFA5_9PLEO|nr:uncharacterized protein P153DRAFT_288630 [Dothidotthia symphoricarpi CBS 119687]KAF2130652.1 hypothetical protein P153DRAFT_288630 [Dothidotthia symphoricarpi CBS 119687]
MSKHPPARPYRLYPAYCFRASPTFDAWVKITAADVQALRSEPEFQGQRIYFHLNHPIRYVRIVGVVVAIDDINLKYTVLTIDDGSGANIELKIVRTSVETYNPKSTPTSTQIDNVNVISQFGVFEVTVDHVCLDIGSVIKAKGTISEFRGIKQLELKRIWVISTTNEEAQAWAETAAYKKKVLSTPWHIGSSEHEKIKNSIKAEKKKVQDDARQDVEREVRRAQRRKDKEAYLAQREVKLESRRRREETMMDAGALI